MAANIKTLVDGGQYIQHAITSIEQGITFHIPGTPVSGGLLSVRGGEAVLRWNQAPIITTATIGNYAYTLPIATADTLGGVRIGSGFIMSDTDSDEINVDWEAIGDENLGLEIFDNTTTDFQSATQVGSLITTALNGLSYVAKTYIIGHASASGETPPTGATTGDFIVRYKDDTQAILFNTIVDIDVTIRLGSALKAAYQAASITVPGNIIDSENYLVVGFDDIATATYSSLSALIPTFEGDTTTTITTDVTNGVITAELDDGVVGWDHLDTTLTRDLEKKMDLVPSATEYHLASFVSGGAGQVGDSGYVVGDFATSTHGHGAADVTYTPPVVTQPAAYTGITTVKGGLDSALGISLSALTTPSTQVLEGDVIPVIAAWQTPGLFRKIIQSLKNLYESIANTTIGHKHDGTTGNGVKISYNNLTDLPVTPNARGTLSLTSGQTNAHSFFAPASSTQGINIDYRAVSGSGKEQFGVVKLRRYNRLFVETDVFGDAIIEVTTHATVGSLTFRNLESTSTTIEFLITYI